ncbi:methyltransferase domain-containing protein [Paenibacillus sp. N4]|uniref:methyltransferase domain-containing protein n=1 Tax=Paenibacillus vietnamensis TaxID=2590547 RepID=UPI001CD0BDDC|nr:methyltransferase domain-containing protein [Paenibacillus vietnamensis]MCA0758222.1 methyltransferase domain-containing protein [Paenibacillus vietnamensis]
MLRQLRSRAEAAELMDDAAAGGAELSEALRQLRLLNRLFFAAAPTLYGVKRLWRQAGSPARLSILDIGAGSGDVNRKLLKWADKQGVVLTVTLVDMTEEACAEARRLFAGEPRVKVQRGDLFTLSAEGTDIVTGTQFLHHFEKERVPAAVKSMLKASRLGVVINDIHRHGIAWTAVWVATRLFPSRYIRNDGPLSVAKGFRGGDWRQLRDEPGLESLQFAWRPLFRYAVILRKAAGGNGGESGGG